MAIDKIGSKALLDCSVAAADIAPGTITTAKLAGSITNAKLANSTVTINGTAIALGASGSVPTVSWQSVVVSDGSTVTTMVAGRGYFVNNTSAAGIVKLPTSASAGDTIAIKDYAGNFGTNKLTIQRNGHKIQGNANDSDIKTNRASVQLVYIDATKGWLYTNESNVADLQQALYVTATGGTVSTVATNFKVHVFTGDGNFVVSCGGNTAGNNKVDYMVVAGGSAGGNVGGGGAGGYRESYTPAVSGPYTASPLKAACGALAVTAQTYPITVGAGGTAPNNSTYGNDGSPSVFSTITSAGGGGGAAGPFDTGRNGKNGGSAGGGHSSCSGSGTGGTGNTPPVSPPQGNNGGTAPGPVAGTRAQGAGGGGSGAVGANTPGSAPVGVGGAGGAGVTSGITGSNVQRAAGGGGGYYHYSGGPQPVGGPVGAGGSGGGGSGGGGIQPNPSAKNATDGSANTGSAGGGAGIGVCGHGLIAGAGGKGVVVIRYKFQN